MSAAFVITIDGRPGKTQPGESVLAAARKLGLDIPTLCYLEKCGPLNTCQVCLVKVNGKLSTGIAFLKIFESESAAKDYIDQNLPSDPNLHIIKYDGFTS